MTQYPTLPVGQTISASDVALLRAGDWLERKGNFTWPEHRFVRFVSVDDDGLTAMRTDGVVLVGNPGSFAFTGRPIDADGWIEHHGGENPAADLWINVRQRGYQLDDESGWPARSQRWTHTGEAGDIIAWKPHVQRPASKDAVAQYQQAKRDFNRMRDDGSLPECDGCDAGHRCMGVGNVCNPKDAVEASGSGDLAAAMEFMDRAGAMLGRGEMPATGTAYAAQWYQAHATVLAALRPQASGAEREALTRGQIIDALNSHIDAELAGPTETWAEVTGIEEAADAILALSPASAPRSEAPELAGADIVQWFKPSDRTPESGKKFVALHEDGSGAWLGFMHDGGIIDSDGDDYSGNLKGVHSWAYLPTGYEFCCEDYPEDAMTLPDHVCPPLRPTPDDRLTKAVEALASVIKWGESRCPCFNDLPDPCPLCDASVANFEGCKAAEKTFPPKLLGEMRQALSALKGEG